MYNVYFKTVQMLLMIGVGYAAKRRGLIPESGARLLSKIMINITLPCVIIGNLNGLKISSDLLMSIVWGVLTNGILLLIALFICKKKGRADRYVWLYCLSIFNISGYAIPVIESFATEREVAALLLFNLPTTIFNYMIPPWLAGSICKNAEPQDSKERRGNLKRNTPGMVILIMVLLSAAGLTFPPAFVALLGGLRNANSAIAMLSIGVLLEFPRKIHIEVIQVVAVRLVCVIIFGLIAYFGAIPLGEIKNVMTLVVFAPNPNGSPALAMEQGYEGKDVALTVSFYLPISVLCISLLAGALF